MCAYCLVIFNYGELIMARTKKQTEKTLEELRVIGFTMAAAFANVESLASQTKREALITTASQVSTKEEVEAVLTAYAESLEERGFSNSVVRVRKAEANSVFKAVLLSAKNLKAIRDFDGNYNELIGLARSMLPAKTVQVRHTEPTVDRRKGELTDKKLNELDKLVERASPKQLADVVDTAAIQINKLEAPKLASQKTLILIHSLATAVVNNTYAEDYEKQVCASIAQTAQDAIEELTKVIRATSEGLNKAKQKTVVETAEETIN
jgi:hypothetical protein